MLREIHIDKFNKIAKTFKPDIFNSLTVLKTKPYNQHVERYIVTDQHQEFYCLYRTEQPLEPILQQVPFLDKVPKILLFPTEKDTIIIEEQTDENLYEYLLNSENQQSSFISLNEEKEVLARKIIRSIKVSLDNYRENNVEYNAIHPKNIVRKQLDWELSLVGLLLKNEKESEDYYKSGIQKQFRQTYALGTLLFKLLFGFAPFQQKKEFIKFNFKDYPKYLDKQENKKFLKVYAYAQGMLDASPLARDLIESALSGQMNLEDFYNHNYFQEAGMAGVKKQFVPASREIKMLSLFTQSQQSLILAAIEHRKKYPHERLNPQLQFAHDFTKEETVHHLSKHPVLCEMELDANFKDEKKDKNLVKENEQYIPILGIPYFYREEQFDCQLDLPCRDLMKLIESTQNTAHLDDEARMEFQARLKVYGYPYAVAFQLAKHSRSQPLEIQKKIQKLSEDLLQISQLNYFSKVQPLHNTSLVIKSFDDIKIRFRQLLNELYKHFLGEAIKKYNVKKEALSYQERSQSKAEGLEYYKLCLKLMECSVLNRKKGRDLDLQRMETSTRKEVEADLNHLLKQYFPNKIEYF